MNDDTPVIGRYLLPREEFERRRDAVEALAAELRARGWWVSQAGAHLRAARVPFGHGREISVERGGFVWRKGGSVYRPAFAPIDDIVGAADVVARVAG
ncbi:hypothetical protein SMC26_39925 [Actinomadura fulvescens]|uniref:Uncharacterized protein n=1 Tax=Actinomadura fulvescens TaxID=46160 RepID=A0ABP6DD83_9ACTN